jgi:xylulokinase
MSATGAARPAVLGIDLGTSSVKAVVTDGDGRLIGQAVGDYPVDTPRPGWAETDPWAWLSATVSAVRVAVARSRATPLGIGFSGQMHGIVATDAAGVPVRPAMLWPDARAVAQLAGYRRLPAPVRARLANPLSPGMAGPLLAWLVEHEPEAHAATRWALSPKDWLRAQLTGRFATEPTDASATLLYDVPGDRFDDEVVAALGLDPDRLPDVLPRAAAPAGELTRRAAELLGLPAGIPVAAGAADVAAAALGAGLVEPGTAALTIGTGVQVIRPVPALPEQLPADPITHLYRAATDHGWYAMGAGLNGGSTLAWVCRTLGVDWPQLYAAAATEPAADDPIFLPHLHGERTPYLDTGLRGAWIGLAAHHGREQLLRAALEGVAFAVRDALEVTLTAQHAAPQLRLAGGGSTDPGWRQLLADVLDRQICAVDVPAASALGAATLAARAAGLADEPTALAQRVPSVRIAAEPHPQRADHYRERHASFTALVRAVRGTPPP